MIAQEEAPAGRIPREYQEVVWVGSNSDVVATPPKCVVNTGFVPKSQGIKIETDFYTPWMASRAVLGFLDTTAPVIAVSYASSKLYFKFGPNANKGGTAVSASTWYHLELYNRVCKLDGATVGTADVADFSGNSQSLHLLTGDGARSIAYLKETKIWDENGNLVRDLVPCYRKSDGRMGFYDLVGSLFYTNTTGDITDLKKGADVT